MDSTQRREAPGQRYRSARTVEEVTERNVAAIAAMDAEARASRTVGTRIATAIAASCGTMSFVLVHVLLFALWIGGNVLAGQRALDPFPFTLLTLIVSLEAIFLSSFILIAANEESRLTERRNALDLQINLLTEQENTKMLGLLQAIAHQVGVPVPDEAALAALEEATRPERLAEQIDRVARRENGRRPDTDAGHR